jgi:hypothetical protein
MNRIIPHLKFEISIMCVTMLMIRDEFLTLFLF